MGRFIETIEFLGFALIQSFFTFHTFVQNPQYFYEVIVSLSIKNEMRFYLGNL